MKAQSITESCVTEELPEIKNADSGEPLLHPNVVTGTELAKRRLSAAARAEVKNRDLSDSVIKPADEQSISSVVSLFPSNATHFNVKGKFLYHGDEKYIIKGTTYGTFEPQSDGYCYPARETVVNDFKAMAGAGINSVRVYTVPPRWLLDIAYRNGLSVMVGIPWEQHLAFLDYRETIRQIEQTVKDAVIACKEHPAVLAYSIGNEINSNVVRWLGKKRVENFLQRLRSIIKKTDSDALVTYVNFPTTEYLNLEFLDFISFNVYLEEEEKLLAYLYRLQQVAAGKPLLLAEIGMDSRSHGTSTQAHALVWQLRNAFNSGCIGTYVFAWTDDWFTEGHAIEDWDFGLMTRARDAKPALSAVSKQYEQSPFDEVAQWPEISVVICSYNGAATLDETLTAIKQLDYPAYEVLLVDDGSTDETAAIGNKHGIRVISTENCGLSSARNTGYLESTGEIVAYIDDDAYPDCDWLRYLAIAFRNPEICAAGGPNLPPPSDGFIADCVARSPGSPLEVLVSDTQAEHIPGCNMSFRRDTLVELGGFDLQFRIAGDDVDICWRVLENGGQIGFHPAAVNWHHRRNTVSGYLRQQTQYGKAEALLTRKWPEKYSATGHIRWRGSIYGQGSTFPLQIFRDRVYSGVWGSAAFQRLYKNPPQRLGTFLLMPEAYLVLLILIPLSTLALFNSSFGGFVLIAAALSAGLFAQALRNGLLYAKDFDDQPVKQRILRCALISCFHLVQPVARLKGRLLNGLYPLKLTGLKSTRRKLFDKRYFSRKVTGRLWDGQNKSSLERLSDIHQLLKTRGWNTIHGNGDVTWDMQLNVLPFGAAKLSLLVEPHEHNVDRVCYQLERSTTAADRFLMSASVFVLVLSGFFSNTLPVLSGVIATVMILALWLAGSNLSSAELEAALEAKIKQDQRSDA